MELCHGGHPVQLSRSDCGDYLGGSLVLPFHVVGGRKQGSLERDLAYYGSQPRAQLIPRRTWP